ncbi:MAG: hypothetical protein OT477_13385 [Chloroflexi bacterium]|nr:hypothetical protein [Chloroflexota bacterium]
MFYNEYYYDGNKNKLYERHIYKVFIRIIVMPFIFIAMVRNIINLCSFAIYSSSSAISSSSFIISSCSSTICPSSFIISSSSSTISSYFFAISSCSSTISSSSSAIA